MEHDIKFYALISVLALMAVASILTLKIAVILASLFVAIFLVAFYKLHYIVDAVIFKRTNLIQVIENCELGSERATAIRKLGTKFCATAVAALDNTSTESVDKDKIEKIIANSGCAFRFVVQVERIDINKLLNGLQTRRSMREIELSRLNDSAAKSNVAKANTIKRQIELLDHEIDRVSTGGAPLKVAQYIMTSAISDNKSVAQEQAKSQLRELASEFGALIGTRAEMLSGNELLDILKFDATMV